MPRVIGPLLLMAALGAVQPAAAADGMYVWTRALELADGEDDRAEQLRMLEFCRRADVDVRRLYFLVDPARSDPAALRGLLRRAARHGVAVFALHPGGLQNDWARPFRRGARVDHDVVLDWVRWIAAFDSRGQGGFAGIQLDIEPHRARAGRRRLWRAGRGLEATRNHRLALRYLELLDRVRAELDRQARLRFAVTAPTWFDRPSLRLERDGRDAPLIAHVQERADFVTLMNYVGDASRASRDAAIAAIAEELRYGPVESMFETSKSSRRGAGREETLYRAGADAYRKLRRALQTAYAGEERFIGCAVHHYTKAYGGGKRRWR